jgi:predicted DNA-binding protein (UPF0251 family)
VILSRCSGRGEQILREVLKGNSLNEAATIIGISPQFVKQVLTSVRRKMVRSSLTSSTPVPASVSIVVDQPCR